MHGFAYDVDEIQHLLGNIPDRSFSDHAVHCPHAFDFHLFLAMRSYRADR
jgi:hypothetical protein